MNAREIKEAIQTGNRGDQQKALAALSFIAEILSTAVLELAGDVELKTGRDPLSSRPRMVLAQFIELPPRRKEIKNEIV